MIGFIQPHWNTIFSTYRKLPYFYHGITILIHDHLWISRKLLESRCNRWRQWFGAASRGGPTWEPESGAFHEFIHGLHRHFCREKKQQQLMEVATIVVPILQCQYLIPMDNTCDIEHTRGPLIIPAAWTMPFHASTAHTQGSPETNININNYHTYSILFVPNFIFEIMIHPHVWVYILLELLHSLIFAGSLISHIVRVIIWYHMEVP